MRSSPRTPHSSCRRAAAVAAFVFLASTLALVAGCGRSRPDCAHVSGQVLIDGQPLRGGTIRLYPANARPASARIGAVGRFTLKTFDDGDGAVLGAHPVTVTWVEDLSDSRRRWLAPKKYADPSTSDLTAVIDGPTDSLIIELTWGGGKPFIEVDPR